MPPSGATVTVEPLRALTPPAGARAVECAQAIFTSIRTPMGEGYRIVAASSGLDAGEKSEITRRAPSHGALLGEGEGDGVVGLLAFMLSSGRHCVGLCRFAGQEYSGRGGQRVWTHFAVLDTKQYVAFGNNPVRVHGAIASSAVEPSAHPPTQLERLSLAAWSSPPGDASPETIGDGDGLAQMVGVLLGGGEWAVAGARPPLERLAWAFDMTPPDVRAMASLSSGLSFSLMRRASMAFVGEDRAAAQRMIRGHGIGWCDLEADIQVSASPFDDWLTFVRFRASEGRLAAVGRLTSRMVCGADAESLGRIARLHSHLDVAQRADEDEKAALRMQYASFVADGELETELLVRLRDALKPPPEPEEDAG